jgi:Fe-S cluster assembly protein SufB
MEGSMTALDTEIRDGVERETVEAVQALGGKYKYGWETEIEMEYAPKGVNEDIVRLISEKNGEPEWMTDWRLQAFKRWKQMEEPEWAMVHYPPIDYQDQYYYARPKSMQEKPKSLDEVDPELLRTYEKLGIPLKEQMILAGVEGAEEAGERKVAVDAVFDSVSVGTTFKAELEKAGVIFCSISEAIKEHPELVKKYLGSVVPITDNFFATLNSAVFSDGSFVYVPPGVRCPMELSTYFRINAENTGQFERTLIIADKGATCPISKAAPRRSGTRISCMRPWWNSSRSTMRRSSIPPCRTGTRATRTARAASTTSSPSAPIAGATGPR